MVACINKRFAMNKIIIPPVFVLLGIAIESLCYFVAQDLNAIPFPYTLAGLVLLWAGFTLMGKTRELFKQNNTTLDIAPSASLVTDGVFSRTRNPMYIGMFLFLSGISVCFGNLASMAVPFAFLLAIKNIFIPKEEKLLQEAFGGQYLEYKSRVRRWV